MTSWEFAQNVILFSLARDAKSDMSTTTMTTRKMALCSTIAAYRSIRAISYGSTRQNHCRYSNCSFLNASKSCQYYSKLLLHEDGANTITPLPRLLLSCRRWKTTKPPISNNNDFIIDPFVSRHLSRLDIPIKLHKSIVEVLQPVYGTPLTVSHLQAFGPTGLKALATSLQEYSIPNEENDALVVPITIEIPHHSTHYTLEWNSKKSLLQFIKSNADMFGEYMEGTCGGNMSCCTCHVYLSQSLYDTMEEPTEAELDMLDLAFDPKPTSRLACQVYANEKMMQLKPNERIVTIPEHVVDLWS